MSDAFAADVDRGERGHPVDSALFALLALGLVALLAPGTAAFTTDSDAYLDVAANLRSGRGLVQSVVDFWRPAVPDPLGMWPPLYPALVALLAGLGLPLETAARVVPALSFAVFAAVFHALCTLALGRSLAALVSGLVLVTPGVLGLGVHAWSEGPFLALLTAGLVLAAGARSRRSMGPGRAAVAGLLLGLAALTRYVGVPLAGAAVITLLFSPLPRRSRIVFVTAALVLPMAWIGRNFVLFGRPFGPALPPAHEGPLVRVWEMMRALRWELLPAPFDRVDALALGAGVALVLGIALALRQGGVARAAAAVALLLLATVLVATSTAAVNAATGRYLAPALPFAMLAAFAGLAGRARPGASGARRALATGFAAVFVLAGGSALAGDLLRDPPGPSPSLARRADLSTLSRLVPPAKSPVLSDVGHLVRLAADRPAVQVPPAAWRERPYGPSDDARWATAGVREAVFAGGPPPAGAWVRTQSMGRFTRWIREGDRDPAASQGR